MQSPAFLPRWTPLNQELLCQGVGFNICQACRQLHFLFRELLVSLHSVLGGPLLSSALHLIDKGAVKVLVGRISGKKVVQVQVNQTKVFGGLTLLIRATLASATTCSQTPTTAHARPTSILSLDEKPSHASTYWRSGLPLGSGYIR